MITIYYIFRNDKHNNYLNFLYYLQPTLQKSQKNNEIIQYILNKIIIL